MQEPSDIMRNLTTSMTTQVAAKALILLAKLLQPVVQLV